MSRTRKRIGQHLHCEFFLIFISVLTSRNINENAIALSVELCIRNTEELFLQLLVLPIPNFFLKIASCVSAILVVVVTNTLNIAAKNRIGEYFSMQNINFLYRPPCYS